MLILGAVCRFCQVHGWSVGGIATKGKSKIRGQRRPLPWSMPTHLLLGSCEDAMTALRTVALEVKCVGIFPDFSGGTWDSMVNFRRCPCLYVAFTIFQGACSESLLSCGLNGGAKRCLPTPRAGCYRLLATFFKK